MIISKPVADQTIMQIIHSLRPVSGPFHFSFSFLQETKAKDDISFVFGDVSAFSTRVGKQKMYESNLVISTVCSNKNNLQFIFSCFFLLWI